MIKNKKFISIILAACCVFCGAIGGCDKGGNGSSGQNSTQTQTVYTLVAEDIALLVGTEYTPDFCLKANGEQVEEATLTFNSLASDIVSVANGQLKAEKVGVADIEVVAKIDGKEIAKTTISCKVNENKGIHPLKSAYVLYISNEVKGVSFETSSELSATVYAQGEILSDAMVTWSVGDENVARVDENGDLQAVALGETYVVGEYKNASGESLKTQRLPVRVEIPVLTTQDDIIVDKQKETQVFNAQKILGKGEIGSIENLSIDKVYSLADNQMKTSLLKAGEYTCIFYDAEQTIGVQVNLFAADFVVYDKEDLLLLPSFSNGYIVLANDLTDIDFLRKYNATFSGIFNGLGHTISDIRYKSNSGLFYWVNGATIKNVSIVNATLESSNGGAFFERVSGGEAIIDNTYVSISCASAGVGRAGGVCAYVWRGKLIYSNSIVYANAFNNTKNGMILGRNDAQVILDNCFAIGTGLLCGTENRENRYYATVNRMAGVAYASQADFIDAMLNGKTDFSSFNRYWDFSQDVPCM